MIIGFINMVILVVGTIKQNKNKIMDNICEESLQSHSEKIWYNLSYNNMLPEILIIIPFYKEELKVLERTLLAVNRIDYPKNLLTIVVGDDGKKESTRNFLEFEFPNVNYHKRINIFGHAKAGNINDILFANLDDFINLKYKGKYVLILDCDMAPLPDILSNMLPLFYNKKFEKENKCCFVQSPQSFCNIKGIDFLGQNYYFFYKVVMKSYNGYSLGVPCCGTNVLFDREILMDIGGMQYGSITEDFNTSLKLHTMGFYSEYCDKTTAVGFSPISLLDFYNQRERWSLGGLQIVFNKKYWNNFKKLPIIYKWIYTFSGASPILSFFMIILIFQPIIDIYNNAKFTCGMTQFIYLSSFLPYSIVYISYLLFLQKQLPWPIFILSLQESIFMIVFNIQFFFTFIFRMLGFRELTFKITPKKVVLKNYIDEILPTLFLLFPYILYFLMCISSIIFSYLTNKLINIDIFWIIFIGLQFLNPILFVIQSLIT